MKIKKAILENFRCFKRLEVDFAEQLTVFVAANGQGKTAILEAVTYLLGIMLGRLPQVAVPKLKMSDFRTEWLEENGFLDYKEWRPVGLAPYMRLTGENYSGQKWDTTLKRDASSETLSHIPQALGGKEVLALADTLIDRTNNSEPPSEFFPVFAYYDTERAVIRQKPERRRNFQKIFNRFDGYKDALNGQLKYKKMIEWLCFLEDKQRREKEQIRDWDYQTLEQITIQSAIKKMLPGFKNLRTVLRPLDLIVDIEDEQNSFKTCRIDSQLSDGYKIVLVLVLDLVSRILELNADIPFATPEELLNVPGVVLIDEVDLHLHPSWQQRIIGDLQRTFPNIQFIVTTHSPQVVSSVPKECIRVIANGEIVPFDTPTQGVEISDILAGIFGTDPIPQNLEIVQKLNKLHALLAEGKGNSDAWNLLFAELKHYYGNSYPPLLGALKHKEFLQKRKEQENA